MMLPLPAETRQKLILSVGTHQGVRPFSPMEVAAAFAAAIEAGASLSDCSEEVHLRGTSMVSRFLRLLEVDPSMQHLVDWGQTGATIAFTSASELTRLSDKDQLRAVKAALEHAMTVQEIKSLVQRRLRSNKPIDDCIEEVIRARPIVVRRHVIVGAIVFEDVAKALSAMTQLERDELFKRVLSEYFVGLPVEASRLGVDRFTLVGGDELGESIVSVGEDLERAISEALLRVMST